MIKDSLRINYEHGGIVFMLALPPRQEGWTKEGRLFPAPPPPPLFLPLNVRHDTSGKCSHLQNKGISEPFFHLKTRFSFSLPPWITPSFYPLIFLGLFFLSACSGGGSSDSSSTDASNGNTVECEAGMVAGQEECRLPASGHYANSDGEEVPCKDIENKTEGWLPTPEEGLAEDACPFTCNKYHIKIEDSGKRACNLPNPGHYADAQGENAPCTGTAIPLSDRIGGQAVEVTVSNQCPFTCKGGYVKKGPGRSCDIPDKGKYANAQGGEASCNPITEDTGGFKNFENNTGAVTSATGCPFSCNTGFTKNGVRRACRFPSPGKYADVQGREQNCDPISNSNWASNTRAVPTVDGCEFTCTGNTIKDTQGGRTCNPPGAGVYYRNGNTETACTHIPNRQRWIAPTGRLTTDTCDFDCKAGYKKVRRACNAPTPGKYLQAGGSEGSCSPIPNRASWVESPATTADGCDFTCSAGFEKHGRTCRSPESGKWVDSGIVKDCTVIPHSTWTTNTAAVTSATGCAFSCVTGFTKNIATPSSPSCDLPRGHFIAGDKTAKTCGGRPATSTGWITDQSVQSVSQKGDCAFECATGRAKSGTGSGGSCTVKQGYFLPTGSAANRAATPCGSPPANSPPASSTGWAPTQAGSVTSAPNCVFVCATGRTKSGTGSSGSCTPNRNYFFTSSNSQGTSCGTLPQRSTSWNTDQSGVTSQSECRFTCNSGYIMNHSGRSCDIPDKGKYANAQGGEASCNPITEDTGGFKNFENNTGAVASATGCPFSCNGGFVKNEANRACTIPGPGKYADADSLESSCANIAHSLTLGGKAVVVANADSCPFTCDTGYFVDLPNRKCRPPAPNKYVDDQGDEQDCSGRVSDITHSASLGGEEGVVITDNTKCPFTCKGGYVKNDTARTCTTPNSGEYADANGDVQQCNTNSATGSASLGGQAVPVTNGDSCPFTCPQSQFREERTCVASCTNGYVKDGSDCRHPSPNHYADSSGVERSCNTVNVISQSATLGGKPVPVANANSCPFTCNSGYVKDGRACNAIKRAEYIATDSDGKHTCAILESGEVKCWGDNNHGQLGLGDKTIYDDDYNIVTDKNRGDAPNEMGDNLPIVKLGTVDGTTNGKKYTATTIAAGSKYTCAILNDDGNVTNGGPVKCWGKNDIGQLGLGDKTIYDDNYNIVTNKDRGDGPGEMGNNLPVVELGTVDVTTNGRTNTATAISAGNYHTCVILKGGKVKCWGHNEYGQLGLGDTDTRGDGPGEMNNALPIVNLGTNYVAKAIAAGEHHTCVILEDGNVKCWGKNDVGQLGLGNTHQHGDGSSTGAMGDSLLAVKLGTTDGTASGKKYTATALAVGGNRTCVILEDGDGIEGGPVKCWGRNYNLSFDFANGMLGLELEAEVEQLGNSSGQMGNNLHIVNLGTREGTAGGTTNTATAISAGGFHTCVILKGGKVKCWGANHRGQLGLGHTRIRGDNEMGNHLPIVKLGTDYVTTALVAGDSHTCAILSAGEVKCWGHNSIGQLGLGDKTIYDDDYIVVTDKDRGNAPNEMGDNLPIVKLGIRVP